MSTRREQITTDVTVRLTRIRGDETDEAFAIRVRNIVDNTLQFEARLAPPAHEWTMLMRS